jgi:hypothetical protein
VAQCRVEGRVPAATEEFKALFAVAELHEGRRRFGARWQRTVQNVGGPSLSSLAQYPERAAQSYAPEIARPQSEGDLAAVPSSIHSGHEVLGNACVVGNALAAHSKVERRLNVIVNAFAPGLKTMPLISVLRDRETPAKFETPKVAVSLGSFGTLAGVQFVAVNQSPFVGARFHVAPTARAACAIRMRPRHTKSIGVNADSMIPERLNVFFICCVNITALWHDRQREIVPIAAFVVSLKGVAADYNCGTVC